MCLMDVFYNCNWVNDYEIRISQQSADFVQLLFYLPPHSLSQDGLQATIRIFQIDKQTKLIR